MDVEFWEEGHRGRGVGLQGAGSERGCGLIPQEVGIRATGNPAGFDLPSSCLSVLVIWPFRPFFKREAPVKNIFFVCH